MPTPEECKWPEHAKLRACDGANQTIGRFIEWLSENNYEICKRRVPTDEDTRGRHLDAIVDDLHDRNRLTGPHDWLTQLVDALANNQVYLPANRRIEEWIADHFGIDARKLEDEKVAMVEEMRRMNQEPTP